MLETPSYIHIVPPDEGGTIAISWEEVPDAEGYTLERRFNEDFSTPAVGLSWENVQALNKSWTEYQNSDQTWAQFEAEPTNLVIYQDTESKYTDWIRYLQYGLEKVAYRIRVYNGNDESEPLESALQFIAPACLHIPALYEGKEASVSWREMTGASGYTLERRWNEGFSTSATGLTWENIRLRHETWDQLEFDNLSWNDHKNMPSSFVLYEGPGTPSPAPAIGLDWRDIRLGGLSWEAFETKGLSWAGCKPFFSNGLSWADQRATYSTWKELETRGRPWGEMENLADEILHASYADSIAIGMKKAIYRLKGHNDREETTYITSGLVPVIPIFERDDEVIWRAYQGEQYHFKLDCTEIRTFQIGDRPIIMKIKYDPKILRLVDFVRQTSATLRGAGHIPDTYIKIHSHINGEVDFTFNRTVAENKEWSSLITYLQFEALRSGNTALQLS